MDDALFFTALGRILITTRGRHVRRFSGRSSGRVDTDCLFRYDEPVSPHLAALRHGGANQVSLITTRPLGCDQRAFYRFQMLLWSTRSQSVCHRTSKILQAPVMYTSRRRGVIDPGDDLPSEISCVSSQAYTVRHYQARLKSTRTDPCFCQRS